MPMVLFICNTGTRFGKLNKNVFVKVLYLCVKVSYLCGKV